MLGLHNALEPTGMPRACPGGTPGHPGMPRGYPGGIPGYPRGTPVGQLRVILGTHAGASRGKGGGFENVQSELP